jgi:molybdopterin-containing oxidoreductase family iron-sulfur binding subunit
VHDGFVEVPPTRNTAREFRADVVEPVSSRSSGEYCLVLYSKIALTDSRHAHNPWLQELPDPVTKVVWDNYVCTSPATAERLGLETGDVVEIKTSDGNSLELPVLIQPGQHDRVLAIALGYGVKGTDRFANIGPSWLEAKPTVAKGERIGKNAAPLIKVQDCILHYVRGDVTIKPLGRRHELASTQSHHTLELPPQVAPRGAEMREPIQETTLAAFAKNPAAGKPDQHHFEGQLWADDHPPRGHAWGMSIDLNACTGCSACLIACQSENNVPVVGKDEVSRQREMHWIRIDRYYSGTEDDVEVSHQPMMCQHCGNAPCETVCPVLATAHGDEGLNEQVYNRCVGTRYCANNCPYKVRRFNWFNYPRDDELQNLLLNPDVTVRSRGVMEKCSMCVQRIQEGKIDAKRRGMALADGQIQTACQQSCPANAITFGDRSDLQSAVSQAMQNPRSYGVLEEFNFQTSVSYLRLVRNREEPNNGGGHV